MANHWTEEQLKAINSKGANILVAAAAGSGKTAVLVERIIKKILKEKIDIDKLLVVTFTNAAASEMRERILKRIYKEIEIEPTNLQLQKQIILLNKSNISTIHSFCLEVIRNYFYEIDISPNFRIGDTPEMEILKQEVLEEVFENLYENKDLEFIDLVNIYGEYRDDENLKEIVLHIYNYIQSAPFPEKWLTKKVEMFNIIDKNDFSKNIWGEILINDITEKILETINELKVMQNNLKKQQDLEKCSSIISEDIIILEELLKRTSSWDELYDEAMKIKFRRWQSNKKADLELQEILKTDRNNALKKIKDLKKDLLFNNSEEANNDIFAMYEILGKLKRIILKFSEEYQKKKKEKNIIDFNDIEHFALKILVKTDENGEEKPTEVAKIYKQKFEEIAIDEYQDSNLVQEKILNAISNNNNIFMVGDVKQSIYKFRQARPELFLEKYEKFVNADKILLERNSKIQLFKNFRSREIVLDFTNLIFSNIMSKELGEINYNENEYLNLGANYNKEENIKTLKEKVEIDIIDFEDKYDDEDEIEDKIEDKIECEAKLVANKINNLITGNYYVFNNKNNAYRKLEFRDIVILLRTTSEIAQVYEKAISKFNFPVFSDTSSNYFESIEIQTIMNVLKIIDNPNNDIPLVAVLRSMIGGFSDNDLVEIRLDNKKESFYRALLCAKKSENIRLKSKINNFFGLLEDLQEKQEYLNLDELIWYIYEKTGYYDYISLMMNGNLKTANLRMLFERAKKYEEASFKGLYNFINYIDKINKNSNDMGSAKLIGENENVIRIMSIHKSKGLEFPVVFLCGTGKQFNFQDLKQNILLHQDLGLGPKYINYERKIEYTTLAKEAIKIKAKDEILAEEMRLLYVALTRSKEKLIITGVDKNLKKSLESKTNILSIGNKNNKIQKYIIKKSKSFLDWIELNSIKSEKIKDIVEITYYNKKDIEEKELKGDTNKFADYLEVKENKNSKINEFLSWKYQNSSLTEIEGKSSVSKITKRQEQIEINKEPKIINENKKLDKAKIGTIIHLVLQKLNFKEIYNENKIKEMINNLIKKSIITKNEAEVINVEQIVKFTNTELYREIKESKEVYKEQPFYINIPVEGEKNEGENILVQGIIDLYYIQKNGNLVLLDYKTDYVPNNEEQYLIEKYKEQLLLYKKALEQSLKKDVSKIYIYSTFLGKEILFEN